MRTMGMIGIGIFACLALSRACSGEEAPTPPPAADVKTAAAQKLPPPVPDGIGLLYFVQTIPCADCIIIKSTVVDILETQYAQELEQGLLHWRVINYEDPQNAALAKRYKIDTTSMVIGRWIEGTAADDHMLPELFELVDDPPMFESYISEELDALLTGKAQ